jgi:hypothetical protein
MGRIAHAVIGAGYGDEGKGLMTDYHVALSGPGGIVVRFNGGAQAGHTVTTPGGQRHVFSHIGSGALAGAATCLSRHLICHPTLFFKEAAALRAAGVPPPPVFGPLPGELAGPPYAGIEDRTNIPNEFQGTLRFAHLDLDVLERSIRIDFADAHLFPGVHARLHLAVSCLDQVGPAVSFIENGKLTTAAPTVLAERLASRLDAAVVYTAWGPTRETVRVRQPACVSPATPPRRR